MPSRFDIEGATVVDLRQAPVPLPRQFRKPKRKIELGQRKRQLGEYPCPIQNFASQGVIEPLFDLRRLRPGVQDARFQL